jgi:hypothetical protein
MHLLAGAAKMQRRGKRNKQLAVFNIHHSPAFLAVSSESADYCKKRNNK